MKKVPFSGKVCLVEPADSIVMGGISQTPA